MLTASVAASRAEPPSDSDPKTVELRWFKGNLHTHSLWSDGDDYPEMIVAWYKENGYHFLALSDHNILSVGHKWIEPESSRGGLEAFQKYRDRFGPTWVEQREVNGTLEVRLKPLNEFRHLFEEPYRFLMIQGEEITDRYMNLPVHLIGTNLLELVPPQGGGSVLEVMQNNVDAVLEQRERTGQAMFPHVAHPNFGWAVTAEDLIQLRGEKFFELYNGHPAVHNFGDDRRVGTERMWDIILTHRLGLHDLGIVYGLAVDDAHNYHDYASNRSNPGRGWVMVRARHLTPESLIQALEDGQFYASTGVVLEEIAFEDNRLALEIVGEEGVTYTTQFIGTLQDFDRDSTPIEDDEGQPLVTTRRYSDELGQVLAEVEGLTPHYDLTGEEIYVRAKVVSSKLKENPFAEGEHEVAWVQPVRPAGK